MSQEKWKPITEYQGHIFDGKFEVSNWGNVRNKVTGKSQPFYLDQKYLRFKLIDENKKRVAIKVHRLVAYAFLDPAEPGTEVDHIDGNPANNSYTNLRWISHKENMQCMHKAYREEA